MAWEREMSTPPTLHSEYYDIFTVTSVSAISSIAYSWLYKDIDQCIS